MSDKLVSVGYTKKTHGAQGELKITLNDEYFDDFVNADVVFMNVQGKPLPFFIENLRDVGDILLKIEEVDSPTTAKHLTSKELFLREQDIKLFKKAAGIVTFEKLTGFSLHDEQLGLIGKIVSVEALPHQYLAIVAYQGNDIFIPIHASLVVAIHEKEQQIILRLPDGLLDL